LAELRELRLAAPAACGRVGRSITTRGTPPMSTRSALTLEEATDITAITQLVARERESRDLCLWNRMADCFFSDSFVDISWFQGNGKDFALASRGMFERGLRAKHRLGPVLVSLNGERAVATLSGSIDIPDSLQG